MSKHAIKSRCVPLILAALVTLNLPHYGLGAEAAFSRDGAHVYLLNDPRRIGTLALAALDVATGQSVPMAIPSEINASGEPCALARSNSGFLLLLFDDSLWAYDPVKNTSAKVCAAEGGNAFYSLACDPITGLVFIGSKTGLRYLEGGGSKLHPVSVRRVDQFVGLTVLQKDHLLFAVRGDGWLGRINHEPLDAGKTFTTLLAYRFAPLATLETGNYTPAGQGVAEFAITNRWLYVHVRRMGGSGDGVIVRMPKPDPNALNDEKVLFDVKARGEADAKALLAMEVIGMNGYSASLCTSPDGTMVFYRTEASNGDLTNWLAKDDQAPRKLP